MSTPSQSLPFASHDADAARHWSGASFLGALGLSLLGTSVLSAFFPFWRLGNPLGLSSIHIMVIGAALLIASVLVLRGSFLQLASDARGFSLCLFLLLLSDWISRPYNLLQGPYIRGEIILYSLLALLVLRMGLERAFFVVLPIATSVLCVACFQLASQGQLLFSDDHATFLYRMMLLKENFPSIPFYNPLWNGGIDARDFFATGALNFFLLLSPVLYFFSLPEIYNFSVLLLLFFVVPSCTYIGCKILRLESPTPEIAATLSMISSLVWYRWALQYGTLGFVTTCALIPLNLALGIRLIAFPGSFRWTHIALTLVSASLMLCWTPSGIVFLPLIFIGLLHSFSLLKRPKVIVLVIALLALNLPWMALFWSASNVSRFLSTNASIKLITGESHIESDSRVQSPPEESTDEKSIERHKSGGLNLRASLKVLRESAGSTNPLHFLIGLPGVFLFVGKVRWMYLSVLLWLGFLGTIAVPLKPQLEFDRMLVIFSFISSTPVALACATILSRASSKVLRTQVLPSFLVGLLLAGALSTGSVLRNRSLVQFHFADGSLKELSSFIRERSRGGRLLFSGFVLHELQEGHLAPLTLFTDTPLIASSFVHNLWEYKQVFPEAFLQRGHEGIEEYLDLYNVTGVFAHESRWQSYFNDDVNYEFVKKIGAFSYYERKNAIPSYFLEGSGEVISQTTNQVRVRLRTSHAILKFHYFPFVTADSCNLKPLDVGSDIQFIRLQDCPTGVDITISSISPFERLEKSLRGDLT